MMSDMIADKSPKEENEKIVLTYDVEEDELTYTGPAVYNKKLEIQLKQYIRSGLIQNETEKLQQKRQRKSSHPKGKRSAGDLAELIVNKPSPTVETMKELLPDMMDAVYYSDEARLKIAGKWQTKPDGWPDDVRLVPPGNYINEGGQKRKTRLADLKPMYDFLRLKLLKMQDMEAVDDKQIPSAVDSAQPKHGVPVMLNSRKRKLERVFIRTHMEGIQEDTLSSPQNPNSREHSSALPLTLKKFEETFGHNLSSPALVSVKADEGCGGPSVPNAYKIGLMNANAYAPLQQLLTSAANVVQCSTESGQRRENIATPSGKLWKSNTIVSESLPLHSKVITAAIVKGTTVGCTTVDTHVAKSIARPTAPVSSPQETVSLSTSIDTTKASLHDQDKVAVYTHNVPTPVFKLTTSPTEKKYSAEGSAFCEYREKRDSSPVPNILSVLQDTENNQVAGVKRVISSCVDKLYSNVLPGEVNGKKVIPIQPQLSQDDEIMTPPSQQQVENVRREMKVTTPEIIQTAVDRKDDQNSLNITVPAKITLLNDQSEPVTGSAMINMPLNMAIIERITKSRPIMTAQPSPTLTKPQPCFSQQIPLKKETVKSPDSLMPTSQKCHTEAMMDTSLPLVIDTPVTAAESSQETEVNGNICSPESISTCPTKERVNDVKCTVDDLHQRRSVNGNDEEGQTSTRTASSIKMKVVAPTSQEPEGRDGTSDESAAGLLLYFSESHRNQTLQDMNVETIPVPTESNVQEVDSWRSAWKRKRWGVASNTAHSLSLKPTVSIQQVKSPTAQQTHFTSAIPIASHLPSGFMRAAALNVRPSRPKVDAKPTTPLSR